MVRALVLSPVVHFQVTTLGKLLTHMCLCHLVVSFGAGQGAMMPCGWEGNRRSDVALAIRHRLQWFIHLWVYVWVYGCSSTYEREVSTLPTLVKGYGTLYRFFSASASFLTNYMTALN